MVGRPFSCCAECRLEQNAVRKGFAVENAEAVRPIFGNGNAARVEEPYAGVMRVALVYFDVRVSEQKKRFLSAISAYC